MKKFLLREMAFLMAPVMLFTDRKEFVSALRLIGFGALFFIVLIKTIVFFAIEQPAGWDWLWVVVGVVVSTYFLNLAVSHGD